METRVITYVTLGGTRFCSAQYREVEHDMYYMLLTENEKTYLSGKSGQRQIDTLIGRVVTKYAVASLVEKIVGITLHPTDIEVLPNQEGAPTCIIHSEKYKIIPPCISIAHSAGHAVAIAVDARTATYVGIDIEPVRTWKKETLLGFLTESERAFCASRGEAQMQYMTRLWCIKEAYIKAIGTGLRTHPRGVGVHIDPQDESKITIEIQDKIIPAQAIWTHETESYIIAGIIL